MEILPHIHCLRGAANVYLGLGETTLTLIDTGLPGRLEPIFDAIRNLGRQPAELAHILITHADFDHAGKAAALQAATGATIHTGAETAAFLTRGESPVHLPRPVQFLSGHLFRVRAVPEESVHIFADGDELPLLGGLRAVATPGHTPDHYAFYSQEMGILFAGDALRTRRGRLELSPGWLTAARRAAAQSALRLLALSPAIIAPGHGRPLAHHTLDEVLRLAHSLQAAAPGQSR